MVTFRNNNNLRRNNFRRSERNFKSNGDRSKFNNTFTNSDNFQRKSPGRNNHNASKLIEKYSNLAREALSSGAKYYQKTIFSTQIILPEFLMSKKYLERIEKLKMSQPTLNQKVIQKIKRKLYRKRENKLKKISELI